ncbi:hypothetical protein T484DRAFT_2418109 [Baffinella frigidus]|nr:hypothetical protein T484DRAFT_2418109 [Cryptophyta sp. CCMP2293]
MSEVPPYRLPQEPQGLYQSQSAPTCHLSVYYIVHALTKRSRLMYRSFLQRAPLPPSNLRVPIDRHAQVSRGLSDIFPIGVGPQRRSQHSFQLRFGTTLCVPLAVLCSAWDVLCVPLAVLCGDVRMLCTALAVLWSDRGVPNDPLAVLCGALGVLCGASGVQCGAVAVLCGALGLICDALGLLGGVAVLCGAIGMLGGGLASVLGDGLAVLCSAIGVHGGGLASVAAGEEEVGEVAKRAVVHWIHLPEATTPPSTHATSERNAAALLQDC